MDYYNNVTYIHVYVEGACGVFLNCFKCEKCFKGTPVLLKVQVCKKKLFVYTAVHYIHVQDSC